MFTGFHLRSVSTVQETHIELERLSRMPVALDFVVLDDQSESHAEELSRKLQSLSGPGSGSLGRKSVLAETKIIHIYTPTTDNLSGFGGGNGNGNGNGGNEGKRTIFSSNTPGVVKMTKPPRKHRLLQMLASLKDLPNAATSTRVTEVEKAFEDLIAAQRTLYGNVLVAEGKKEIKRFFRLRILNFLHRQCDCTKTACQAAGAVSAQCHGN
jgi:hypothetical protein